VTSLVVHCLPIDVTVRHFQNFCQAICANDTWCGRAGRAHAFLWEYSCKGLELAQLLGQLGIFLTGAGGGCSGRAVAACCMSGGAPCKMTVQGGVWMTLASPSRYSSAAALGGERAATKATPARARAAAVAAAGEEGAGGAEGAGDARGSGGGADR
jgi:hypothetical protein